MNTQGCEAIINYDNTKSPCFQKQVDTLSGYLKK